MIYWTFCWTIYLLEDAAGTINMFECKLFLSDCLWHSCRVKSREVLLNDHQQSRVKIRVHM